MCLNPRFLTGGNTPSFGMDAATKSKILEAEAGKEAGNTRSAGQRLPTAAVWPRASTGDAVEKEGAWKGYLLRPACGGSEQGNLQQEQSRMAVLQGPRGEHRNTYGGLAGVSVFEGKCKRTRDADTQNADGKAFVHNRALRLNPSCPAYTHAVLLTKSGKFVTP